MQGAAVLVTEPTRSSSLVPSCLVFDISAHAARVRGGLKSISLVFRRTREGTTLPNGGDEAPIADRCWKRPLTGRPRWAASMLRMTTAHEIRCRLTPRACSFGWILRDNHLSRKRRCTHCVKERNGSKKSKLPFTSCRQTSTPWRKRWVHHGENNDKRGVFLTTMYHLIRPTRCA